MRVDFYRAEGPPEGIVPQLARRVVADGGRLLVVAGDGELRGRVSEALWAVEGAFLANGEAGGAHDARQPILIAPDPVADNGATMVVLADGVWREVPEGTERVFLIFGEDTIGAARMLWKTLGGDAGIERFFWKQEGGRWVQAA